MTSMTGNIFEEHCVFLITSNIKQLCQELGDLVFPDMTSVIVFGSTLLNAKYSASSFVQ